jgi:subtilisin family serine protease
VAAGLATAGLLSASVYGAGEPQLATAIESSVPEAPTWVDQKLVIDLYPGVSKEAVDALLAEYGATTVVDNTSLNQRIIELPADDRASVPSELEATPFVVGVELDEENQVSQVNEQQSLTDPNDVNYSAQWGLRQVSFPAAWRRGGLRRIRVAVVDSGVNSVPDLAGRVLSKISLVKGEGSGDDNGHGTEVAGVIAARSDNRLGGAGACPVCDIISIKAIDASGRGDLGTAAAGIVKAVDMGARVINLSLGGPTATDALNKAVQYAVDHKALVVAAAGNNGDSQPFYPADTPGALSVAGSDPANKLYSWSQRGSWVNVASPGCNVAPLMRSGYGLFCGTSSATPLVSAAAALMFAAKPNATPAQVQNALILTTRRIQQVGHGRIDVAKALAAIGPQSAPHVGVGHG